MEGMYKLKDQEEVEATWDAMEKDEEESPQEVMWGLGLKPLELSV